MADLTVLVPTRGRVNNSIRLFEAFRDTCQADTELIFVISADDPCHDDYYWALTQAGSKAITVSPDRTGVVAPLNAGFNALSASLGGAVGYMGDDHLPKTKGWDKALLGELKKLGTGVAYGNDLLQGEQMATAVVMTSDIPKKLGYLAPPELAHMYIDLVWIDWGKALGKLTYRDDVIIEHLHPAVGKAQQDESYRSTGVLIGVDSQRYEDYVAKRLSQDVTALKSLLKAPVKRTAAKRAPAKKAAPKAAEGA